MFINYEITELFTISFKGFLSLFSVVLGNCGLYLVISYDTIAILIITGSIYFILLDELIIGSVQRRIGPLNLG